MARKSDMAQGRSQLYPVVLATLPIEFERLPFIVKRTFEMWLALVVLWVPAAWAQGQPPVRDLSFFLHRLRTVDHLPELEASHTAMSSTWDRTGGNADGTDFSGSGIIRQMRIIAEPATPEVLRGTRMQITWDGAVKPSVDVPLGHFFGHAYSGHGRWFTSKAAVLGRKPLKDSPCVDYCAAYNSLLLGVTNKEAYSRFPMPFSSGAKLSIENQSGKRIENLRVRLDVERLERIPANWGRFHATWTEAPAATDKTPTFGPQKVPGKVVLQEEGRGNYVGVMLTVDWPYEAGYGWGEGDWMIWTDEDGWPPSYHGTGSEEYFNSGWCQFDRKAVSGFVMLRPGHPTVYSFHLNDAFQFQRNVRVVEEQMGYGPGEKVIRERHPLWTSTAFWYAGAAQPAGSI